MVSTAAKQAQCLYGPLHKRGSYMFASAQSQSSFIRGARAGHAPPAISGCQGGHPRSFVRGSVSSVRRSAGCTRREVWTLHFEGLLAFRQFRRGRRPPRPRPPAPGWSWPYVWPRQLTNPWGWMHGVRPPRTRLRGARAATPIPVEHLGLSSLVIFSWAPVFTD